MLRRIVQSVVVLALASAAVFMVIRLVPGDPALLYAGADASAETLEAVTSRFGLDQPLHIQYVDWLKAAASGDLGNSYRSGTPVGEVLKLALLPTVELALASLSVALVLGITTGVISGFRPRSWLDNLIQAWNSAALSIPNFWLGMVLVLIFSLWLGWLPTGGRVSLWQDPLAGFRTLILPGLALGWRLSAIISRFLRSAILDVSTKEYVRTARAMGLSSSVVKTKYVVRNALLPLVTVLGIEIGRLLGGAVVIEAVFSWPGIGRTILTALNQADYLVVQGALLWIVLMFLFASLIVDLTYIALDPRIKLSGRSR